MNLVTLIPGIISLLTGFFILLMPKHLIKASATLTRQMRGNSVIYRHNSRFGIFLIMLGLIIAVEVFWL